MRDRAFFLAACLASIFLVIQPAIESFGQEHRFGHIDDRKGLSHNYVKTFYKDRTGFLWIGTESGLNRFDGYSLKIYRNDPSDSTSLFNDDVVRLYEAPGGMLGVATSVGLCFYNSATETFTTDFRFLRKYSIANPADLVNIIHDKAGNYWFLFRNNGLVLYNEEKMTTQQFRHLDNDPTTIFTNNVTSVVPHQDGSYWIAHSNGVAENIVLENGKLKVVNRISFSPKESSYKDRYLQCELMIDNDGDLWCYRYNSDEGVFYYNANKRSVSHFEKESKDVALRDDLISGLVQDNKGNIWISYGRAGIDILNKKNFEIESILHDPETNEGLSENSIPGMFKDTDGVIWVGTYKKGLNFFHESMMRFPVYSRHSKPYALPFEDVNRFVEDRKGNLWLGTNGGGLIYFDRQSGRFTTYKHNPKDPHSLSSDVVVSLCLDHEDKLWIGTFFGGLDCFDGKTFTRYQHDAKDATSLPGKSVWEIFEDSEHRLWIGMLDGGLNLFDRKNKTFARYTHPKQTALYSSYISTIMEDSKGNLWFGTSVGIDVLMKESGSITHFGSERNNPASLRSDAILGTLEDSEGRIWIGTQGGLSLWQKGANRFINFSVKDGLPHNVIMSMKEDAAGRLWLGTPNGLSCATIVTEDGRIRLKLANYSEADGLQGQRFNEDAALRTRSGELVFGGANGFNIFKPGDIGHSKTIPRLVLTDFQLFNRSVRPGKADGTHFALSSSITTNPSIVLTASDDVFSIEFAALDFIQPFKNSYKYKLEGFNQEWLVTDANNRKVTFTNLDAGDYVFRVITSNDDGLWSEEGISLPIKVLPPFWKSTKAIVVYLLILSLLLFIARKLIQQREQMKFAMKQQQEEAMRSRELDMIKTKFFTNVSHEFRTPLSLIISPLEKLNEQVVDPAQLKNIELIQKNAKRLLNLVNQLLDFRKMEVHDIRFHPSEGDIIRFVRETVSSFADLSEKKSIRLTFESNTSSLEAIFDHDKVEKILFNLLSNAFKFTMDSGVISVIVEVNDAAENSIVEIMVKDSGIGIPAEKHEQIFERFFQNDLPSSLMNQGSGIGLAITKEFVRIHGGTIRVESEEGKGSSFIVVLPLKKMVHAVHETINEPVNTVVDAPIEEVPASEEKPLILLIEDNEDFRIYLKDNLKTSYAVIEAANGEEGWKKAILQYPDLIVTDVMMPGMDGIELCKKIKSDQRVSHIPVILLTARSGEEQRLEGFEVGADDYIPKPFSFPMLESRIRNLISLRKDLHALFAKKNGIKASEIQVTSLDEQFIHRVVQAIENNVSNSELTVMDLSHELGVSRAQFFRKVQELTNKSPLELIRTIRLQYAAQLLEKSQLSVSEVAYRVGFNNPKYFARHFKDLYHVLPSAYANGKRRS
ncbi:hybrid sensor histidine kinase/response regulator transcription factor [Chryseolinea soli]|uniref:histidine kinase n=1 Tax=Chryseolinea soli TaxID=2321403 RepID=A0A385SRR8_9BACT|nr:two-component regulator propeller domain-containing protein [Chryseolinea soli]AYB33594.1 response regulator [Chryseolinea soli]